MEILKPQQVISKNLWNQDIYSDDLAHFKHALKDLYEKIEYNQKESTQRGFFAPFLESILPLDYLVTQEEDNVDVVIHTGKKNSSSKGVLIEMKSTSNKDEMITKKDINRKALQELLFYFLNERIKKQNNSLTYLIVCNVYELFIWDAKLFNDLFFKNKNLRQDYEDFFIKKRTLNKDTKAFYEEIAKKYIEEVKDELNFTYVDLRKCNELAKKDINKALKPVFKLLSHYFLLKEPVKNDSNDLNNGFYRELLYIIGIEEWKDDNGVHKIRRIKDKAQKFSLMEQTWAKLGNRDLEDKERFETAMALLIIWINRILFLKLLESQLVRFGNGDKARFMDPSIIKDYDILHELFIDVLAKPEDDRDNEMKEAFPLVPYLNSSLFEFSKLEDKYFPISQLRLDEIEIFKSTILKDQNGNRLKGKKPTLQYLLEFLDAYDFGAELVEDGIKIKNKTLINASVLGLIFEKINGYKDGAFFTPGYITEYICRKTLRQAVLDKFNDTYKDWQCKDFDDLKVQIKMAGRDFLKEANIIVNSIKVCDPAVGSGHFLVSALNEMIAIKSDLQILQTREDKPMPITYFDIWVENDELKIKNANGDDFNYDPSDRNSQIIQKTLFEEKRTIIEDCLFGVDLNPKSVEICRLRLWIELLKNAYYERGENKKLELQTLPNIDINIKEGNSLASNYPVCIGKVLKPGEGMKKLVASYKEHVREYKHCKSKSIKNELIKEMASIRRKLMPPQQLDFFYNNKVKISRNRTLKHAFEWMIMFPEVLDDNGRFCGFDVIIGNPPYISLEELKDDSITYKNMPRSNENNIKENSYLTYDARGDLYVLFVERGLHILRKGGILSYILPNKWEKVMYGRTLRKLFLQYNLIDLVDFKDIQIFDDATTYTCIINMKKEKPSDILHVSTMRKVNKDTLAQDIIKVRECFDKNEMRKDGYGIWFTNSKAGYSLIKRLKDSGKNLSLNSFINGKCYYGIKPGCTNAFLISIEQKNKLLENDYRSGELLRPFMQGRGKVAYGTGGINTYLLYIPKGFTLNGMGIVINEEELKKKKLKKSDVIPSEDDAWEWFKSRYPAVAEWLFPHQEKAKNRSDKGDYWWELRACTYYDKFEKPKIFYQRFQVKPVFVYDTNQSFFNDSMYFLSTTNKALLAILCSKMGWWLISEFCPHIQNGYQLIWDNLSQILIPIVLPNSLSELAQKAEEYTSKDDKIELCKVIKGIDKEVYHLYNLTYDEVLVVDPSTSISKEEYIAAESL